jgi:hypothetical protein
MAKKYIVRLSERAGVLYKHYFNWDISLPGR